MSKKEQKNKSADETLRIIEEIFHYNKKAQKTFSIASKVDKGKSEPKPEESIAKRVKLKRQRLNTIVKKEKKKKKTINCLAITLTIQDQAICSVDSAMQEVK